MSDVRLIDANALKEKLQADHDFYINAWGGFKNLPANDKARVDELTASIAAVVNAPTVDAAPVVHAQNVTHTHYSDEFICGHCGFWGVVSELIPDGDDEPGSDSASVHEYECKFCPNCGAKMEAKDMDAPTKDGGTT